MSDVQDSYTSFLIVCQEYNCRTSVLVLNSSELGIREVPVFRQFLPLIWPQLFCRQFPQDVLEVLGGMRLCMPQWKHVN